ncbi:MAG: glycosyltransferase family 9 protein [Melioribacteraceae bacterium]|nr:MAG: glycosyltransferase family 9 protein [Melioribacteraceae bacterium]
MYLRDINKILIIRLSSLGDVLLASPLLRSIKKSNPKIEIDFIVQSGYADALKYNPNISKIFSYAKNGDNKSLYDELLKRNYDLIIDLQNNNRSAGIVKSFSKPVAKFYKPTLKKFLLVHFKINLFGEIISIPERYANSFNEIKLDEKGLELFIPEDIKPRINFDENLIGFCPGSKHFTKMWPAEYFIELGNKLINDGKKIILLGGKDDKRICDEISSKIKGATNLSGENNLLQIAADMKSCRLIICNDSGLMHTACAVNVSVAAIFGSTVKEFGFFPYNSRSLVLENNSLSCRPCSHIGRKSCPKKHFKCMKEIAPDLVYDNIQNFLKSI